MPPAAEAPERWSVAPHFTVPADDSLESATALLGQITLAQRALDDQRGRLKSSMTSADRIAERATAAHRRLTERRHRRAVAAYLAGDEIAGAALDQDQTRARLVAAVLAVDERDAAEQRTAAATMRTARAQRSAAAAQLRATEGRARELAAARTAVDAKIRGVVDLASPVAAGPTPVAAAAAAATASLLRAGAALQVASPDAPNELRQLQTDLAALAALVGPTTIDPLDAPLVASTPNATAVDALVAAWTSLPPARLAVLLFALEQVGKPYVWAAAGPNSFDCSGLMLRSYALEGITLAHFSGAQVRSGPPVLPDQIRPTDLLGYGEFATHHVEMYVGGGRTVEAKGRAWGVVVSDADLTGASNIARIL